ncbi:MAG: hypothetical protein UMV23_02080 [Halanaerobium sp.]|nr:hypothetical protein [Halanaerobium sp.]
MRQRKLTVGIVLSLIIILLVTSQCLAYLPRRFSTPVDDVFQGYVADEWIIAPYEEPKGDQLVTNAPECDIKSVISCFDQDYLRMDIMLHNPVSFDLQVAYGMILVYTNVDEYYIYYPHSNQFIFSKFDKSGKILDYRVLDENSLDSAGVTNSGSVYNVNIYFIINKYKHIGGVKGENYYLTCNFFSGFIDLNGDFVIADETIPVEVEYTF